MPHRRPPNGPAFWAGRGRRGKRGALLPHKLWKSDTVVTGCPKRRGHTVKVLVLLLVSMAPLSFALGKCVFLETASPITLEQNVC